MIRNSSYNIKIALLQISPCKTAEENREKGIRYCRKARESGADIALFPEMWSNGYDIYGRPVREWKNPETVPDCNGGSIESKFSLNL